MVGIMKKNPSTAEQVRAAVPSLWRLRADWMLDRFGILLALCIISIGAARIVSTVSDECHHR